MSGSEYCSHWSLAVPSDASVTTAESTDNYYNKKKLAAVETAFNDDARQKIDPIDFYDGGKYRCEYHTPFYI